MHAAFVADEIWGFMREPARRCRRPYLKLGKYRNSYLNSGEAFLVSTCWGPILYQVHEYFVDVYTRYPGKFWSAYLTHPKLWQGRPYPTAGRCTYQIIIMTLKSSILIIYIYRWLERLAISLCSNINSGSRYTPSTYMLYTRYINICLLYTSPSPRDLSTSRMPSSA